jgi:hypothetical protein
MKMKKMNLIIKIELMTVNNQVIEDIELRLDKPKKQFQAKLIAD